MTKRLVRDWCRHYPYGGVERGHKCDAKIVLVGEAPGKNEDKKGRPFIGESGKLLFGGYSLFPDGILPSVGLCRNDLYITNVIPYRPAGNKFDRVPADDLKHGIDSLRSRLLVRTSPNVVVAAGNVALQALLGHPGIMKWRGSVLQTPFGKVIPVIHPAAVLRQWALLKTVVADWTKIANEARTPFVNRRKRTLVACQENDRRLDVLDRAKYVAVDIETDRAEHRVLCIAFATSAETSFSIDTRAGIGPRVRSWLSGKGIKIFQKGMFDVFVLRSQGITVNNWQHDTSTMFHALDNNVGPQTDDKVDETTGGKAIIKPYSLAYMASVLTDEPYWKDSAKDSNTGEAYGAWRNRWRDFQIYNARDAAVTFEIFEVCKSRLVDAGRWDWYIEQYSTLLNPLLELSLHGVRFDVESAHKQADLHRSEQQGLREKLVAVDPAFVVRHVFKKQPKVVGDRKDGIVVLGDGYGYPGQWIKLGHSISTDAVKTYLKKKLKFSLKRGNDETADEVMLRTLLLQTKEREHTWPKHLPLTAAQTQEFLSDVLRYRKLDSTLRFLQAKSVDPDGRVRSEYSMLIQTGRLSASRNALGTGMNLQNQKRDIRHFYLPDKRDWYLLSVDYSQAEDLVVKALTGDERAIELIKGVQHGTTDIHKRLAASIFRTTEDAITYEQRYVSKRTRHARNFDMQDKRFQQVLLKDGFVMPLSECARILEAVDHAEPWVPNWHRQIRKIIMQHRVLYTSWGWKLDFEYERLRDSFTFRRGYAFVPQSEVGVAMKQLGLKFMYSWLRENDMQSEINMLVHDELVLSCPREELYECAMALTKSLSMPRNIMNRYQMSQNDNGGFALSIPTETTVSRKLKCICEACDKSQHPLSFKNLPSKREFYKALKEWESASI